MTHGAIISNEVGQGELIRFLQSARAAIAFRGLDDCCRLNTCRWDEAQTERQLFKAANRTAYPLLQRHMARARPRAHLGRLQRFHWMFTCMRGRKVYYRAVFCAAPCLEAATTLCSRLRTGQ